MLLNANFIMRQRRRIFNSFESVAPINDVLSIGNTFWLGWDLIVDSPGFLQLWDRSTTVTPGTQFTEVNGAAACPVFLTNISEFVPLFVRTGLLITYSSFGAYYDPLPLAEPEMLLAYWCPLEGP